MYIPPVIMLPVWSKTKISKKAYIFLVVEQYWLFLEDSWIASTILDKKKLSSLKEFLKNYEIK